MDANTKLSMIKTVLGINDNSIDSEISVYIELSKQEILNWLYTGKIPSGVRNVPSEYEVTQIYSVVAGYSHQGGNDELSHNENGINRSFRHSDMLDYIHREIIPYAKVV